MTTSFSCSIRCVVALLTALSVIRPAHAADRPSSPEITRAMAGFVEKQVIAGAVTLVARDGKVAALDAVGFADLAARTPMRKDHLFWIASMTKPMTGVAVVMLQDEGRLSVDDLVEKHLPEFRNQWLVAERGKDTLTLKRPARPVTIKDLLTHTSGLGNLDAPRPHASLAELVTGYSQVPLQFEPGSKWQYSNPGINTLGRIVEVVSGRPFAEFMEQRLFQPLGMKDTTFWPTSDQARRVAKSYQPGTNNQGLAETDVTFLRGLPLTDRRRTPYPAGGLYSTAEDVAKFYQIMLDGGTTGRKRLLSEAAVRQLTTTQSGDIKTGFTEGMSWGLGFQVVKEPQGVTAMLSSGTFGHGGAYGTQSWGDPRTKTIYILMIQRAKMGNSDGSDIRKAFQEAANAR
jgi:CubicO group peptidase (beta-lactamase class C family)